MAFVMMLCYTEFAAADWKKICRSCLRHIGTGVGFLAAAFIIYAIYALCRSGALPDFSIMSNTESYDASIGAWMLPMTPVHPWNFVILVYCIGLTYAVQALFNKQALNAKAAFIFILSVMGIGLFSYFQGRSHNWNLFWVSTNAIILLTVFADMLIGKHKIKQLPIAFIPASVLIVATLGFSCADLYRHQKRWSMLQTQREDKKANLEEQRQIERNVLFIKELLPQTTDKIYINTSKKYQALYFTPLNKRSAYHPAITHIFTYKQVRRFKDRMLCDSADVFLEPRSFYYPFLSGVNAAMGATYSVNKTGEKLCYLKKRTYRTPLQPLLAEDFNQQILFYDKFGDDTTSLNRRVEYATEGAAPLQYGSTFSAEIIFHAEQQAYQPATLFTNSNDSTGLWLLNNGAAGHYILQWAKNYGVEFNVEPNRWHYLVFQFSHKAFAAFIDGALAYNFILPAPVTPNERRFYVAGSGSRPMHYVGAIAEILIKNGVSLPQQIQERHKQLQEHITR
jgi:hypothetical protein